MSLYYYDGSRSNSIRFGKPARSVRVLLVSLRPAGRCRCGPSTFWLGTQLVNAGCNVIALSRKGAPAHEGSWTKSVKWVKGNALVREA